MRIPFLKKKRSFSKDLACEYIDAVFCKRENLLSKPYELKRFLHGKSAHVFRLQPQGHPAYVVRFHRADQPRKTEIFFRYQGYLRENFNLPKMIFTDRDPQTISRFGFEVSLERFVEGEHLYGDLVADPRMIEQLARVLATFHDRISPGHGLPWDIVASGSLFNEFMSDIQDCYRAIPHEDSTFSPKELQQHLSWFKQWKKPLDSIESYNFLHGDVHRNNMIVKPNGDLVLLDFGNASFGFFEWDLVFAESNIFPEDPDAGKQFLDLYFSHRGEAARERYQQNAPFFLAYRAVRKAASNTKKIRRNVKRVKAERKPHAEIRSFYMQSLRDIIEGKERQTNR